ncbi:MAG: extracellular solute-binding protein, partial [Microbacterium gubbeenense]
MTHKRKIFAGMSAIAAASLVLTGCGGGGGGDVDADGNVVIELAQWWEPELPDGALRGLVDQFEEQNPGIKVDLLSGPYASTREQLVTGAASGTMPDVVG